MIHKLIFICLFFLSTSVFADANDGDYLGFTLGERFTVPRGAVSKDHITGALVYIVNPVQRMQHIGSLSVYVSPKSSIIGSVFGEWYFASERSAQVFADRYLRTLEEKYPHWIRRRGSLSNGEYQLWVDLEKRPPIVDHWPSRKNFRVGVALGFVRDSAQQNQWAATLHTRNIQPGPYGQSIAGKAITVVAREIGSATNRSRKNNVNKRLLDR